VQCLQRLHGGREAWVRHGGTMFALFRLRDKGLLSGAEYARLAAAYQFLRYLEHRLQLEDDRQTHTLPADADALGLLARKMPPAATGRGARRRIPAARPGRPSGRGARDLRPRDSRAEAALLHAGLRTGARRGTGTRAVTTNLTRFLDQRAPGLAAAVALAGCSAAASASNIFSRKRLRSRRSWIVWTATRTWPPACSTCSNTAATSPTNCCATRSCSRRSANRSVWRAARCAMAAALRRYYRRQMLRIQTESILEAPPIFSTLGKTSVLADSVIEAAYQIAVAEAPPPASRAYVPSNQMMVIALGRLGMREFDLGSDADLVFVIPDADVRRARLLDRRGRAHGADPERVHGRGRDVRRRYAPAPQRPRRRPGAIGRRVQELFRAPRRGLGRHRLHEIARRGGQRRSAPPSS
jgi:glutamate-ammonia-ligase adenylyltransferase